MKTNLKNELPDYCPACEEEGDIWEIERKEIEEEFRGETFKVSGTMARCKCCGFEFTPNGAMDEIVHATWSAYKEKHGVCPPPSTRTIHQDLKST